MKVLDKEAEAIFRKLLEILGEEEEREYLKIDNSNGVYMPLSIQKLDNNRVALAHYGKQNGDLMADPDMEFEIGEDYIKPLTYQNDYMGYFTDNPDTEFANMWLRNIKEQQKL